MEHALILWNSDSLNLSYWEQLKVISNYFETNAHIDIAVDWQATTADLLGALLGEKNSMDVRKNSSRSNSNSSKKLVQLLIVLYGKSNVPGHDTTLLVITSGVSSKLEDLSTEVLENSSEVDGSSSSDTGSVLSLSEVSSDTSDGELKSCLCRRSGGFLLSAASFSFSCS